MRAVAVALAAVVPLACAAEPALVSAFSAAAPGGALPAPWRELALPHVAPPRFALVDDNGVTVLRVQSQDAAGTVAHALRVDPARRAMLAWRWKIDHVVAKADMTLKSGDDFAARVYVFFDVPVAQLPLGDRIKLLLARVLYGQALPSAALCYVWDNRHPVGMSAWSPYTDRVRMVVLESGPARAGRWVEESRDLAADFRSAFGERAPVPAVTGIAAGSDTDQTGESVTAWFGDFRLGPARAGT